MSEPSKRSLRPAAVAEKLGVSVPTVWRYVQHNPKFPRPFKLTARVTLFDEGEIDAYLASLRASAQVAA